MDFSSSPQDATEASDDPSTMTDLNEPVTPAPKDTASNELLTTDEQESVGLAVEETVSPAQADTVNFFPAETVVDEWFISTPSSPRSDPTEPQPAAFSRIEVESTLQEFESRRAGMLTLLERAGEMNEDGDSTMLEEHSTIIQRLLQSVELGIGEMQACIVNFFNRLNFSCCVQCFYYCCCCNRITQHQ